MIHDARVEVTCDGEGCTESIEIQPDFVYRSMSGASGYYDCSDSAIEKKLLKEGWRIVLVEAASGKKTAKQSLCEECARAATGEKQ